MKFLNSTILDLAIGLAIAFLLLLTTQTMTNDWLTGRVFNLRAKMLRTAITRQFNRGLGRCQSGVMRWWRCIAFVLMAMVLFLATAAHAVDDPCEGVVAAKAAAAKDDAAKPPKPSLLNSLNEVLRDDWQSHASDMLKAMDALSSSVLISSDTLNDVAYKHLKDADMDETNRKLFLNAMGKIDPNTGHPSSTAPSSQNASLNLLDYVAKATTFKAPSDGNAKAVFDGNLFTCSEKLLDDWYGAGGLEVVESIDGAFQMAGVKPYRGFYLLLNDYLNEGSAIQTYCDAHAKDAKACSASYPAPGALDLLRASFKEDPTKIAAVLHSMVQPPTN